MVLRALIKEQWDAGFPHCASNVVCSVWRGRLGLVNPGDVVSVSTLHCRAAEAELMGTRYTQSGDPSFHLWLFSLNLWL